MLVQWAVDVPDWGSAGGLNRWGTAVMAYCLVPAAGQGTMPDVDSMLATAVWLACDEQRYLQTAVSRRIESALTAQMVTFALTRTFGLF